jgi:hypothetical protein
VQVRPVHADTDTDTAAGSQLRGDRSLVLRRRSRLRRRAPASQPHTAMYSITMVDRTDGRSLSRYCASLARCLRCLSWAAMMSLSTATHASCCTCVLSSSLTFIFHFGVKSMPRGTDAPFLDSHLISVRSGDTHAAGMGPTRL